MFTTPGCVNDSIHVIRVVQLRCCKTWWWWQAATAVSRSAGSHSHHLPNYTLMLLRPSNVQQHTGRIWKFTVFTHNSCRMTESNNEQSVHKHMTKYYNMWCVYRALTMKLLLWSGVDYTAHVWLTRRWAQRWHDSDPNGVWMRCLNCSQTVKSLNPTRHIRVALVPADDMRNRDCSICDITYTNKTIDHYITPTYTIQHGTSNMSHEQYEAQSTAKLLLQKWHSHAWWVVTWRLVLGPPDTCKASVKSLIIQCDTAKCALLETQLWYYGK
jgi:hypothetical protein